MHIRKIMNVEVAKITTAGIYLYIAGKWAANTDKKPAEVVYEKSKNPLDQAKIQAHRQRDYLPFASPVNYFSPPLIIMPGEPPEQKIEATYKK